MRLYLTLALTFIMVAGCIQMQPKAGVDKVDGTFLVTGGNGSDWAATGYNYQEQRFSPLTQINAGNVGSLGLAWFADLPDSRGMEATPIVIDGKLFVTGAWSKVFAFDAVTGKPLWSFDPHVDPQKAVDACCDVVNRGVAAWKGRLYLGALDGRLIAIDADTGKVDWSVQTTDPKKPYTITGVPRVFKDIVVIGSGGAEFGVRGYVTAYSAKTGAKKWRFYTVPSPTGARDGEISDSVLSSKVWSTWSTKGGAWHKSGGGGTVWDAIVYDAELDQLYIGVGNGSPWNHGIRSMGQGDNLFLSSIVALKPDTGEYLWHYQETPGESWDFTATQPIVQTTLSIGGRPVKVLMQAPKNGFFFVIDRTNGKLLSAKKYVDTVNWADRYDLATGRPVENPAARYYRTGKPFMALPSAIGAHNWQPMSFSPDTGLIYLPTQRVGFAYAPPVDNADTKPKSIGFNTALDSRDNMYPRDAKLIRTLTAASTGSLVAWDPVLGKKRWKVDYPTSSNGGTMATAGNLVFQGTSLGEFRAYAADTGRQLLSYPAGSAISGGAATYSINGEQYVAVLTGKGGAVSLSLGYGLGSAATVANKSRLLVFSLSGKVKLPVTSDSAIDVPPPPPEGTPTEIAAGRHLFGQYCQVCHGANAAGGGPLPNLQQSAALHDAQTWQSILIDGILKDGGMVSFSAVLKPDEAQSVRYYIIDEARWSHKALNPVAAAPARGSSGD